MDRWLEAPVLRLTVVLLAAGLALIALGTARVGGSLLLVVVLLVAGGALYALSTRLAGSGIEGLDRHRFYADLPFAPLVAAVVALRWLGATPGELQALGGLVGLVGMLNYFLRPLYHLVYRLGVRVSETS